MGLSFNSLKKKTNLGSVANVMTGGASGAIAGAIKGDAKGAIMSSATMGVGGTTGAYEKEINKAVSGSPTGSLTGVKTGNTGAYQAQSDSLMNPVADQFSQFGQNSAVTSNVDPAFRQYQLGLAQQLQNQANGQGPSLAQMQLQQATDRTMNQSLGAIRSATGANAGLSARTAALSAAQGLGTAANASGQLRLQEQQAAQQQLAGLANQGRSGDLTTSAQSLQAQQATQANRLAGIQGLAGVRTQQLGTAKNIYDVQSGAAMAQSANQNKLAQGALGGLINVGATAAGAYFGGPAGAAAGGALASQVTAPQQVGAGNAGYDAMSGEAQDDYDKKWAASNAGG